MYCDVIVVGGGVAGLAAAGRLAKAGRSVVLLEARVRLGGRIHTLLDTAFDHPVELGAEFIQGSPPEFLRFLQDAGLRVQEIPERHRRARRGGEQPLPPPEDLVDRLLGSSRPGLTDVPVARLIRESAGAIFTSSEIEALTGYLEGFHGADLERFGTAALAENQTGEAKDGEGLFRLERGYGALVSHLVSELDSRLVQVRTGVVVTRLHWQPGKVVVEARTIDGDQVELAASQVILSVPLGSLKAADGMEGAVAVDPIPPGWKEALGALELGAAQRIDLQFDSAWWMEQRLPASIFVHGRGEPFPVWWTTSPPELPFLTGWVGGPRALGLAGRSQEELVRLGLLSASSIFGVALATLEGRLRAAYSYDWTSDPFSRGAYSYGGVGGLRARETLRQPVADTLFLAGEALALEGRNATVPGALSTGFEAAAAVLKLQPRHQGAPSQPLPADQPEQIPTGRPLVRRYSGIVRAAHWLNAVFLVGMIASGLQIYNAYAHFGVRGQPLPLPNPFDGRPMPQWSRLGGWLAGGLNWHFLLAWPFVITGLVYLGFLALSGEWRTLVFRPRDLRPAVQMQLYYLRLRKEHPPQGKHNALQKAAYSFIVVLGAISALSGFAIYKPVQLSWLTSLFGGYELARYWHFVAVWLFVGFTLLHVALVLLVDPASLRGMITGWYRGRFPSHD